jgi:hypothetical protein
VGNVGRAVWIGWLATFWLIAMLILSVFSFMRGLDIAVLALALIVQVVVIMLWTFWREMPLWIVAFHGMILLALVLGLAITAPTAALPDPLPPLSLPWLIVGLVPTGAAMLLAVLVAWNREHVVGA